MKRQFQKTETLRFKRRLFSTYKTDRCKFLFETLEPEAIDSYFNWNEFDGILGQKNISQIMFSKILPQNCLETTRL